MFKMRAVKANIPINMKDILKLHKKKINKGIQRVYPQRGTTDKRNEPQHFC